MPRKKAEAITFDPSMKSANILDGEAAKNILGTLMTVTGYNPSHYIYGGGQSIGNVLASQGLSKEHMIEWFKRWTAEKKDREQQEKLAQRKIEDALYQEALTLTLGDMRKEHIAVLKKRKVF